MNSEPKFSTHAIYDRLSKILLFDDLPKCFRDPAAFAEKPNRPSFHKFVDCVASLNAEEGITFWCAQLKGLPRYDLLFQQAMDRDFITSRTNWIRNSMKHIKPKHTTITFSTITHVAWALALARASGYDNIFFCALQSCRQMALPGI